MRSPRVVSAAQAYLADLRCLPREAWIVLAWAVALGFTWQGLSDATIGLYIVRMGYGPAFLGSSSAAANLGYALTAMPAAALAGRIGARRGQIVGSLGWMLGLVLVATSDLLPGRWQAAYIVATRVFAAAGLALAMVSQQPFLARVTPAGARPLAFALMIALRPVGAVLGGVLGGALPGVLVALGVGAQMVSLSQPRPYGLTLALGALAYVPVIWALRTLPRDDPRWVGSAAGGLNGAPPRGRGSAPAAQGAPAAAVEGMAVGEELGPAADGWLTPAPARKGVSAAADKETPACGLGSAPAERGTSGVGSRAAFRGPAPVFVLAAVGMVCALRVGGEFTARAFFSVHADANLGASAAQIGAIVAVSSLLSIPAPLLTPRLVKRWGRVATVAVSAAGAAASIALLALGRSWPAGVVGFVSLTVMAAAARAVWTLMLQEVVEDGWRATSAAIANLTSGLGTMAASSLGGVVAARAGYPATFAASAVLVGLGAAVVWAAFRRRIR